METKPQKENAFTCVQTKVDGGTCLSRVLGDMTNFTIGNLTINVNPVINVQKNGQKIDEEFDALLSNAVHQLQY